MDEWFPGDAGNMLGGVYEVLGSMWTKRTVMMKGTQKPGGSCGRLCLFFYCPRRIRRKLRFLLLRASIQIFL